MINNRKSSRTKKFYLLPILLFTILLGFFIASQAHQRILLRSTSLYIKPLVDSLTGVSANITDALDGSEETQELAMIGAKLYLDRAIKEANYLDYSYHAEANDLSDFQKSLSHAQTKYLSVFNSFMSEGVLFSDDRVFLNNFNQALNTFINELQNENGSLKNNTSKEFSEIIKCFSDTVLSF